MLAATALLLATLAASEARAAEAALPLARVGVIGASMTDGLLLPLEVDCMVTLEDVVRAACVDPARATVRRSSALLFRDPTRHGTREVDAVAATKPTLVIALDFLFWFGYGNRWRGESERLAALETGLSLIARFECPVIVGDFPDMHDAINGISITGGPIINMRQIPDAATLDKLNARLAAWTKDHPNVHVLPLARLAREIRDGREIRLRSNVWPSGGTSELIGPDRLHPTLDGTISLVLHALDQLTREDPRFSDDAFVWDKDEVRTRVLEARKDERDARLAMKQRRTAAVAAPR